MPLVTLDDFRRAGAMAFSTPTRFGVVSAQLKNMIDRLSPLWQEGALEGKPEGEGSPYGRGHVAGQEKLRELDEDEKAILRVLRKRLAEIGLKLQK